MIPLTSFFKELCKIADEESPGVNPLGRNNERFIYRSTEGYKNKKTSNTDEPTIRSPEFPTDHHSLIV